jgi:hypothetical protein
MIRIHHLHSTDSAEFNLTLFVEADGRVVVGINQYPFLKIAKYNAVQMYYLYV